ncbi:MAG TPA: class I SAM-dependent methyltransferase [Gemmatimonadales bacterium]|nr:class I SAM-dependent methyltransferase [Gemmatimonadales bacterium]
MRPAASVRKATAALPLRLGAPAEFRRVADLLLRSAFDEPTVCKALGIDSLANLGTVHRGGVDLTAIDSALALLIKAFVLLEPIAADDLAAGLDRDTLAALEALDLVRVGKDQAYYAPVLLYPVHGCWIASDRHDNPDGSPFVAPPDVVFPAIFAGTLRFLRVIPKSASEQALDLCSGSGIGALVLSRSVRHVVASDLTARATHFAQFNRLLNGCENVEVVQGDLYQPVAGRQFDRIVAHPPYVPALSASPQVFRDAGDTGESVLQRIVEGLPQHLRPAGVFCAVSAAWDTESAPFEARARRWLGAHAAEFDVTFAQQEEMSPEQVARWLTEKAHVTDPAVRAEWEQQFTGAGLERNVYGALVVRRRAQADRVVPPQTVRVRLSGGTEGSDLEWALRWYRWRAAREAAGELSAALLKAAPRLAPGLQVKVTYAPHNGELGMTQVVLEAERPFRAATKIDTWMLPLVAGFGSGRRMQDVYDGARAAGAMPEGFGIHEFGTMVTMLIERGYLELDGEVGTE